MASTAYEVIEKLGKQPITHANKGSKSEHQMEHFDDARHWKNQPDNRGVDDTGIDLVAVAKLAAGNVAIQTNVTNTTRPELVELSELHTSFAALICGTLTVQGASQCI